MELNLLFSFSSCFFVVFSNLLRWRTAEVFFWGNMLISSEYLCGAAANGVQCEVQGPRMGPGGGFEGQVYRYQTGPLVAPLHDSVPQLYHHRLFSIILGQQRFWNRAGLSPSLSTTLSEGLGHTTFLLEESVFVEALTVCRCLSSM